MKRSDFLQSTLIASTLLGIPLTSCNQQSNIQDLINNTIREINGNMIGFSTNPINTVRVGIIGLGNRGNTLLAMFQYLIENNMAEIIALSDIKEEKLNNASKKLSVFQKKKADIYCKDENDWKKLAERDDIDLVIIATPWSLHTVMAIYCMEMGKHVGSEVPISSILKIVGELLKQLNTQNSIA